MTLRKFSFGRFALLLAAALIGLYTVLAAELYFNQAKHVYHPTKEWSETPGTVGMEYETLTLTSSDGVRLSAWHVPATDAKGTVLVCHGNARNISGDLDVIEMFHKMDYNVLIMDYRGFGKSEGTPDEQGTYRDAQAAWDWLTDEKGESPGRIVILGRSLGGAVGAQLAARNAPAALIIEAAFTSLADVGQELYPIFPVRLLSRYRYDTREMLKQVRCPVLVIHSRDDELIPFHHANALYAAVPGQKLLLEIGGPHKGGYTPTLEKYRDGVRDFLRIFVK